jgi:hypothetical protein
MGSKSKGKSLFSEQMLIKHISLAHYVQFRGNIFIRIPDLRASRPPAISTSYFYVRDVPAISSLSESIHLSTTDSDRILSILLDF